MIEGIHGSISCSRDTAAELNFTIQTSGADQRGNISGNVDLGAPLLAWRMACIQSAYRSMAGDMRHLLAPWEACTGSHALSFAGNTVRSRLRGWLGSLYPEVQIFS